MCRHSYGALAPSDPVYDQTSFLPSCSLPEAPPPLWPLHACSGHDHKTKKASDPDLTSFPEKLTLIELSASTRDQTLALSARPTDNYICQRKRLCRVSGCYSASPSPGYQPPCRAVFPREETRSPGRAVPSRCCLPAQVTSVRHCHLSAGPSVLHQRDSSSHVLLAS